MKINVDGKEIELGLVQGANLNTLYNALREAGMKRVATWHRHSIRGCEEEALEITERLFVMPNGEYVFYHSGGRDSKYAIVEPCVDPEYHSSFIWSDGHLITVANHDDVYYWIIERFMPDEARRTFEKHGQLERLREFCPDWV